MNDEIVAQRFLECSKKGSDHGDQLVVEIYKPYLLKAGMVDFDFSEGTAGCSIKIKGLDSGEYIHEVYGADTLQALELATNVEPMLERLSKDYDLYFPTGEPYFD